MTFIEALCLAMLVLFGAPLPPGDPVDPPKPECESTDRCAPDVEGHGEKPVKPAEEPPPAPPLSAILKAEFTKRISNGF